MTVAVVRRDPHLLPQHPALVAVAVPFALLSFMSQGLYDPHHLLAGIREFVGVVRACSIGLVGLLIVGFLLNDQLPRTWSILAWLFAIVIVAALRLGVRRAAQRLRRRGMLRQRALLVGANSHSINIARQLSSPLSGLEIVGVLDDYLPVGSTLAGGLKVLGAANELSAVAARTGVREAIVVPQALPWETLEDILTEATSRPDQIRIQLSAGYYDLLTAGAGVQQLNHVPLLPVSPLGLSQTEAISKRALDYSVAGLLLFTLWPVLLVTVLVAHARLPGVSILQRTETPGRWGRPFRLLSLAPEVSRFTLVRKLPGLVNVLRGELSVVGPRPVTPGSGGNGHSAAAISLRPGLTGLWREADDATEQALLDLYYIRGYSLWMDMYILLTRLRTRLWRHRPGTAAREARAWFGSTDNQFVGFGEDEAPKGPSGGGRRQVLQHSRLTVATTYPEGAILAVARAAASQGSLSKLYTTLSSSAWMSFLSKHGPTPKLRRGLERELKRRSLAGIPRECVETKAQLAELVHRGARLIPRSEAAAQRLEYLVKGRFDRIVAQRIAEHDSDAVVAMSASAEETLRSARTHGQLAVLHLVNNHPRFKNQYLKELAGLPIGHHELVPQAIADRVERELEVADLVLVPSQMVAAQLRSAGLPADRIVIEPFGVDPWKFGPAAAGSSRPAGRRLRCLFVGNVCHGKGIRVLIQAAARLEACSVEFKLVGPLRSSDLLRRLPGNVEWAGSTSHSGVAEEMRNADIFVLPSVEDAYPLVTMEAMACGLPVIVTTNCGTHELITDGEDGLIVPAAEVEALVRAIERLVDDPDLRISMGAAARRTIKSGPAWEDYGARVLARIDRRLEVRRPEAVGAG
jgi:glycosyltransferase involved in cell wall biosynthesis/lipopolysaccharide/colanic/teichoic acid biosynthesis glycosyltransferase